MYKGDKPGDDACLIVLSVVSLYSWLFFSCPFPWPFIINSQCCFYTTLGRTAHHIPLLAQLCKEKDARVPLDGFFFFFSASSWILLFTELSQFNTFTCHLFALSKKLCSLSDP